MTRTRSRWTSRTAPDGERVKGLDKDEQDKDGRYIRRERYYGSSSRSFYVGDLRPEEIKCKYESGVLSITVPKKVQQELPASTRIAIE